VADRFQNYYQRDDLWAADVVAPHGAVADEIIALLPKEARSVLDVGCGNGAISNAITDRLVVGSDIALAAIKHMRHPACLADICDMPFADNSFDLVMATDVLEHIPDNQYARACAELERISRRWILIAVPYRELLDSASVECARCGVLYHVHWHQRSYDETFMRSHWTGRAAVSRWGLAGERWIWNSQAVLDLKHAAAGRNYDFPQAVCPECGTVRGESQPASPVERQFESLQYSLVEAGASLRPPRSEILALFDKQAKRHAPFLEPEGRLRLPGEIRPRELLRRENPEAYPSTPYVTDVRRQSFVIALPSLPKVLECPGVEAALFDGVAQAYQGVDLNSRDLLPDVSPTRFGYLLRIDANIATCPAISLREGVRDPRVLHMGGGAVDAVSKARDDAASAVAALERRREAAEQSAVAAMRSAASLEAKLAGAEREAAQVEARRVAAERAAETSAAAAAASEARIESLLKAGEDAERSRQAAELAAQTARDLAERMAREKEKSGVVADTRIQALLEAADKAENARVAAEAAVQALSDSAAQAEERRRQAERIAQERDAAAAAAEAAAQAIASSAAQAEERRQQAERIAQERDKAAVAAESRIPVLLDAANQAETSRAAAEAAAQASSQLAERIALEKDKAAAAVEARIQDLLNASEKAETSRVAAEAAASASGQLAERIAQERDKAASAAEARIQALLNASEKAETSRVAAEAAASASSQLAQRVAQEKDAAAVAAEARIRLLLDTSERIETSRAAAELAAQARGEALKDAERRVVALLGESERAQQDAAEAARKTDLIERHAKVLEDELEREKAANIEANWQLGQATQRESAMRQRLTAEGALDSPRVRPLVRRYKRALVETLDLLTVWRAKPRAREWPSQVIVVSHMYPREGNRIGGIFVHDQVKALRAKGIDVRVFSGEPFWCNTRSPLKLATALVAYLRTPARETEHEGVPVTFFPWFVGSWVPAWAQSWTYSHGLMRVVQLWSKDRPVGIVHAHTANLDGPAGRRAADRLGVPLFLTEHTGPFDILTQHPLRRRRTRAAVRAADRVFAVSSALRGDMIRALGAVSQRVEVLPNGVDLENFVPASGQEKRRATRALWIGHHVPVKRIDRLLPAFANALKGAPDLTLSLLGGGELLEQAGEQARSLGLEDKVTFLPAADREGVAQHIREHDYVVISSETETFALVALEAMACGKPVLSTACGGPQDIILNGRLGMIVENSQDGLTQGLVGMANRAELFDPRYIRAHVARTGSWKAVVDRLTDAYIAAHHQRR
jgi:glycosyltransferase involved in cell wall biosynthesis/SAM-dependent methyltransferase